MPRGLPQAAIDALAGDQANTAVLVEIDAATVNGDSPLAAPIRLTNRPGGIADTFAAPDAVYTADSTLRVLTPIREALEPRAADLSLSFIADGASIARYLTENPARWRVRVRLAILGNAGALLNVVPLFAGYGAGVRIAGKTDRPEVTLTAASHWAAFEVVSGRQTNTRSQEKHFPGDAFFNLAFRLARNYTWGANEIALDSERNAVRPLPLVYGTRKVEAQPIYQAVAGDGSRHLYMVSTLCEGPIDSVLEVFIDDKPLHVWNQWAQFEGDTGPWASGSDDDVRAVIRAYRGLEDQQVDRWFQANAPGWTANHRGRGVAFLYMRFTFDEDYFKGVPRVHAVVRGKLTPDVQDLTARPRYSENYADQLYDYLTSARYGAGIAAADIDAAAFAAAAAHMDSDYVSGPRERVGQITRAVTAGSGQELITLEEAVLSAAAGYIVETSNGSAHGRLLHVTASTDEIVPAEPDEDRTGGGFYRGVFAERPRQHFLLVAIESGTFIGNSGTLYYRRRHRQTSNWIVDTAQKTLQNIKESLVSGGCWLGWIAGRYTLIPRVDTASVGSLDHVIIAGSIDVTGASKRDIRNEVKAEFENPNTGWETDEVLFPGTSGAARALYRQYLEADGAPLTEDVHLPTVTDADLAYYRARLALYERRGQTRIKTRTTLAALQYAVGDVVGVSSELLAWAKRPHRITAMAIDFGRGRIDLEAIEHDSLVYTWALLSDTDLFRDTGHKNPLAVATPTAFTVASTDTIGTDLNRQFGLEVSWTAADATADTYELRGRKAAETNDGPWTTLVLRDTYYQVAPFPLGSEWDLQLRALNNLGSASPWTRIIRHTIEADTTPPALPTDVSVQGGFQQLIVSWTPPPNVDLALVELYVATMGDRPPTPDLTVSSGSQGILAGLIDDTAYLVWLQSVDIAGNRSDPAGPYRGRTSRFGERDVGVLKREYIYRTHPTGQLRPPERAMDNWRYDQPVAPWQDNAPSLTAGQPFLLRDERPVPADVEVGDAVDGQWIGAAIIGHYGVDGTAGVDGSGVEFVYALTAAGQVGNNQMPDNNWLFDRPGLAGGLRWYDEAPDTTPARPFLVVAARRTQGFPRAGDRIADVWGRPAVQSHYGDDGVSASVGAPVIWFEQPDGSYEPAATTQDVDIRFYRGRREFAQGTVHFQRVGNGLHDSISTDTPAEVLGEFRASFSKGRRGGQVLGITATWHGLDGDETNNISITACAYIVRAGVSEERIRQLVGEVIGEGEQPPTQQPETQPPATTTQITQTAYHRAAAKPAAPTSAPGSYPPSGWREIRPSPTVTAAVWQSTRTVTMRNGAAVSATNWTTPTEVAARLPPPSTQTTQTAYHRAAAKPAAPTSAPGSYPPSGWSETQPSPTVTAAVWQSTRTVTMRNGAAVSATNWTTPTEVAARLPPPSTQTTQTAYHRAAAKPAAPTSAPGSYPPSGWSETQPSPTVTAAVWQSTRTVTMRNGAAVSATNWTTPTEVAARLPPPSTQTTQTAYHRAAAKPAAPTSAPGSYPPSGWSETQPSPTVTAAVWQSTRTVTMRNGAAVSATNWTTPTEVAARLPQPLMASATPAYEIVELSSVHGSQGVIFLVSASGGVPPYTGTGSFTRYFSGGGEGIHDESFTVTDDAGNSATVTARVEVVVIQGDV